MAAAAILKTDISPPWFERFRQNLAQWRSSSFLTVRIFKNKILKVQDCGCHHLEKSKIEISWQQFDQSPRNLAWWGNSTLMMRPKDRTLKFKKSNMSAAAILKNRKIAIVTFQYSFNIFKQYMYITTSTEQFSHGIGNSAMGQIPCSTERISCCKIF